MRGQVLPISAQKGCLSRSAALKMLVLALVGLDVSCSPIDIPAGPDLKKISAIYDEPDGSLPEVDLASMIEEVQKTILLLDDLEELNFVIESLEDVADVLRNAALRDDNSVIGITGVTTVHSICPGAERVPTRDEKNGALDFMITFDKSYIGDVIWGRFKNCKTYKNGESITIDSTMDIYLGDEVFLGDIRFDHLLFRVDGEFGVAGHHEKTAFDFRVATDSLELRMPAIDGDVVFNVGSDAGEIGVRTANGSFCCAFAERTCYQLDGVDCDSERSGFQITW